MKCQRCDYRADDLTDHAATAGHQLCVVCQRRSLTEFEPQTCTPCVGRVRTVLAELVDAYAMLTPTTTDALTLLGDGSMQRMFHSYETAGGVPVHPLVHDDDTVRPLPPIRDEWTSDPLPVVAALASWEDFWREHFGDPAGGRATLAGVTGYLLDRLDRAAQAHPAFDEFAAEVRRHRAGVRAAVGLADVPVEADAKCFDCGGFLLRTYRDLLEPVTTRRARGRRAVAGLLIPVRRQRAAERSYGIRDLTPWPVAALDVWRAATAGRSGEGLTDDWTCEWCERVYDQPGYFLALRAASSSWVPVPLAAETARRSVRTVRSWVNRGQVSAACRVVDRVVVVWWPDVSDRAFRSTEERTEHAS